MPIPPLSALLLCYTRRQACTSAREATVDKPIKLTEKYERNGWPSVARPDLKPPEGWSLSLLTSIERIRTHRLSPDGQTLAYIKDGETLSDVYLLPASGGWPARLTTDRGLIAYWDDEVPQWSPDGQWLA